MTLPNPIVFVHHWVRVSEDFGTIEVYCIVLIAPKHHLDIRYQFHSDYNFCIQLLNQWWGVHCVDLLQCGPILSSAASSKRMTCGRWSPSRPAVFYIGKQDGSVDVWDLLDRTHEPSMNQNVTQASITNIFPFAVTGERHMYINIYVTVLSKNVRFLSLYVHHVVTRLWFRCVHALSVICHSMSKQCDSYLGPS